MKVSKRRIGAWLRTSSAWLLKSLQRVWDVVVWPVSFIRTLWHTLGKLARIVYWILAWLFWPLIWTAEQFWRVYAPVWRYLGRLGAALRVLLWESLWPLRVLLHFSLVRPFKRFVWTAVKRRWDTTAPTRYRLRRRWRSRWAVRRAKVRLLFKHNPIPAHAVLVPAGRRPAAGARAPRYITAFVTVNVVLLAFSLLFVQLFPGPTGTELDALLAAGGDATRTPSPTPTLTPSITPTPTNTPTPTPAVIALTPWPTPDPLRGGGSVAFTLRQNGNSDIYALSIGQDQPVRLTNHPSVDRDPAWSPDGRSLAFTSRRDGNWEVYVLDLPTGEIERITHDLDFDGGPGWSPDGQWLVYEAYRNDNLDVYIVKRDGSEGPIRITENPAPDYAPVWSPDGRHIAFTSWRSGNKDIFLMPLNEVRDDRALNLTASPDRYEDAPVFSPDGRFIAYYDDSSGFDLVYALPLAGYRPVGEPITLGQGREPAWSPGGASLAYIHAIGDQQYLIASSIDAWAVAPQTFATDGRLSSPNWSAISLAQEPAGFLVEMADTLNPPLFTETISRTQNSATPYQLIEVPAEAPYPFLSDRVDQAYLSLRQRVAAEVGWDPLARFDKMYEPIEAKPAPNQSNRAWHKAGRAFDFSYDSALTFNPQMEITREDRDNETYWRVYLRAVAQDGSQGEPLRDLPWDFRARFGADPRYYDQGGAWKERIPPGYYVDFTAVAADYGWERVPALENWRTYFPGIRFWQYENHHELTWEEAMREIYSAQEFSNVFGR